MKSVSVNRDYFDTLRLEYYYYTIYYNMYTFSSAATLSEWIFVFLSFKNIAYLYGLNNSIIIWRVGIYVLKSYLHLILITS